MSQNSPDGQQFSTKQELRNYMMSRYSFRNHNNVSSNSPLLKAPGEIDGQVFEISDCNNSSLVVMDYTEQVQIDNLDNCRVFIGACSSVIYIRNCKNCNFFTCSKQLRLREVTDSVLHTFTQSEIHIELSDGLKFGPFIGGYSQQKDHFEKAGFNKLTNLWFQIYDHNDVEKTRENWTLLEPFDKEYQETWFPIGECEIFIPISDPASVKLMTSPVINKTEQSFGLDQLIADDKFRRAINDNAAFNDIIADTDSLRNSTINTHNGIIPTSEDESKDQSYGSSHDMNMETALLVAYSLGKGININVWMSEELYENGHVPVPEFNRKLTSLASMVGMNQDEETKQELEQAVSKSSLRNIQKICGIRSAGSATLSHINVNLFVKLCQEKMDKFMGGINSEEEEDEVSNGKNVFRQSSDENYIQPEDKLFLSSSENRAENRPSTSVRASFNNNTRGSNDNHFFNDYFSEVDAAYSRSEKNIFDMTDKEYIEDLKSKRYTPSSSRPQSAPAGRGVGGLGNETSAAAYTTPSLLKKLSSADIPQASRISQPSPMPSTHFIESSTTSFDLSASDKVDRNYSSDSAAENNGIFKGDDGSAGEGDEDVGDSDRQYLMSRKGRNSATFSTNTKTMVFTRSFKSDRNSSPTRMSATRNKSRTDVEDDISSGIPLFMSKSVSGVPTHGAGLQSGGESKDKGRSKSIQRRHSFSANRMRETSHRQSTIKTAEEKLEDLKDLVEDLIRNTVKKADLYHMIQVHLGFIDSYTFIPPRGVIVASRSREWLTPRELQRAFLAGQLLLTEPQILVLRNLVRRFAAMVELRQSKQLKGATGDIDTVAAVEGAKLGGGTSNKSIGEEVLGPCQSLSAEWLKRYLLHLRLTKRTQSAIGTRGRTTLQQDSQRDQQLELAISAAEYRPVQKSKQESVEASFDAMKMPLSFHDWLGKKFNRKIVKEKISSKEFELLKSGKSHNLSKEEVDRILSTGKHSLVEEKQLLEEISYRVDSWILDLSGRREFQHAFSISLRRHLSKNNLIWEKLTAEEQKKHKHEVTNTILQEKKEEFLSAERTSAKISKDLYLQYREALKDIFKPFDSWLQSHLKVFKENIDTFREKLEENSKAIVLKAASKGSVAGLNNVEQKLKEVAKSLKPRHAKELEKGIVALRKSAAAKGIANGKVVTKEDFDKHIKRVLPPMKEVGGNSNADVVPVQSPKVIVAPVQTTPSALQGLNLEALFRLDLDEAVQQVLDFDSANREKASQGFTVWLEEKRRLAGEAKQQLILEAEKERKLKERRERSARIAFRKWLNLRNQNKYLSMIDKMPHDLPVSKSVDHPGRWHVEKETELLQTSPRAKTT